MKIKAICLTAIASCCVLYLFAQTNNKKNIDTILRNDNDTITIIPDYDKITSVSELLDVCKGQPVFIDYWGTWCSPCLESFKYSDSLHALLKKYGIKSIYICSNFETEDSIWRKTIAEYKLAGYHVRASKYLEDDLTLVIFGFVTRGTLPHYLLFNNQKVLLNKDEPYPDSEDKFYKEIEKYYQ